MANILFFDDVEVDLLPPASAYAGYADGIFANVSQIRAKYPTAAILTIAVKATDVADALDVEPGDAQNSEAIGWFRRALAAGVTKPCFYTSVSNIDTLVSVMAGAGIPRSAYRLWSAHYAQGNHICGPNTCGGCSTPCDATQFTKTAEGKVLDESAAIENFFTLVLPPAPTGHSTLVVGDTGAEVRTLQERLNAWGVGTPALKVDGDFGPSTLADVKTFQTAHKLTADGIVGPATWTMLLKTPPLIQFASPTGLRVESGIISVSWDTVPESRGVHPTGYTVILTQGATHVKTEVVVGTTAVFDGLVRGSVYELEIYANGGQATPGSAKISVTA